MRSIDLGNVPRQPGDAAHLSAAESESKVRNRWAAAYHEAGHAVFAYEVGWWVNYEGIDIEQQFTGLGCREIDYTPWRRVWVHLAGPMAEYRFLGLSPFPDDRHLSGVLSAVRHGSHPAGDEGEVFRALVEQFPDEVDRGLLALYRRFAEQVWHEITGDAPLWNRIESLAAVLFRKGKLKPDAIELLI
jgi:hypothetical protein